MFAKTYAKAAVQCLSRWLDEDDPQKAVRLMQRADRLCARAGEAAQADPARIKDAAMICAAFQ